MNLNELIAHLEEIRDAEASGDMPVTGWNCMDDCETVLTETDVRMAGDRVRIWC